MIDFYEENEDLRDRFEIIAFHDESAKTFEELDEKLEPIREKHWKGRDLPFPVLLDSSGTTIGRFGVRGFPTVLLVDPHGKLVGKAGVDSLKMVLDQEKKSDQGGAK